MRRFIWMLILSCVLLLPVHAQDALNLPSELYVLTTDGVVQRFGLGSEGVSTVTPDDQFVIDFKMAPDANWLAYRTQDGLYIDNIFDDDPAQQLEDTRADIPLERSSGDTIAWAPDGSVIVYTTTYGARAYFFRQQFFFDITTPDLLNLQWSPDGTYLSAEASENVWWIYQRNSATLPLRAAIPGANGADWLSSNQLLYAPIEGGLTLLNLAEGNQQIEVLPATESYYSPSVAQDGQIVAFTGTRTEATLAQVMLDDAMRGTTTVIGNGTVDLTGTKWAPGGFLLTAFQGGAIALVNPINGSGFTLPVSSVATYSWGPPYAPLITSQPLPAPVHFLAQDLNAIQQMWVLPPEGTQPELLTDAPLDIVDYALAPNGQQIAYISNSALWLDTLASDEPPQELVMLGISEDVQPAWSADSSIIYYRDEQDSGAGIWQVDLEGEVTLFMPDEDDITYRTPNPALGAGVMLLNRNQEVVMIDLNSGTMTPIGLEGTGSWQSGTQFIVVGEGELGNGLYVGDANSPENLRLILPLFGSFILYDYRIVDGTLRMLVQNQVPGDVRILDIPVAGGEAVLQGSAGSMVNPRLAPDGLLIIGQRSPEGAMLLYDIRAEMTNQLDIAPPIHRIQWR